MDVLHELRWRGLIQQTSDDAGLPAWLAASPRVVYAGFDPTADSLHVGHLVALMVLRRFQRAGHRPIALVGGATGMIGDPTGKSEERTLLSADEIARNVAGIERQVRRFLDFERGATLADNRAWMAGVGYLDFLRDVGKHFPLGAMLAKESVQSRLARPDGGISYTEFSYMLVQAYDFVHLHRTYGCDLQVGGSDQWGNITAGIELARRMGEGALHGLTVPLLTTRDGVKMGKTEKGALWLSAERTRPYAFYQYWINCDDADVGTVLRMLTELPRDEIEALDAARAGHPERRESQRRLAESLTRLVHGEEGLAKAVRASEVLFGAVIERLSDEELGEIFADVPSRTLARSRLDTGLPVVDAFTEAGLAKSKGEARRTIAQGGAYVNNRRVESADVLLTAADLAGDTTVVLRAGKKTYALLRVG